MMREAGFVIDHEHNHRGQCWWEFRAPNSPASPSDQEAARDFDVRRLAGWQPPGATLDRYSGATDPDEKKSGRR
jgi:hypothetical protein